MSVDLSKVNYILLKSDGSVLKQEMDYYIQQGEDASKQIFFGSLAAQSTDVGNALCTLPNGTTQLITGVYDTCVYKIEGVDTTIGGFLFTLDDDVLNYNGSLMMSLVITRSSKRLVAYPLYVVLNETGVQNDTDTGLTIEEINQYLQYVQGKLSMSDGIVVIDSLSSVTDWTDYDEGQLFLAKDTGKFEIRTDSNPYHEEYVIDYVHQRTDGDGLYAYTHNQRGQLHTPVSVTPLGDTIVLRDEFGEVQVEELPKAANHATSKQYVDSVDVTKVDKTSSGDRVYGTDDVGAQTTFPIDNVVDGNIVRRTTTNQIYVPVTPTANNNATSKKYVDDLVATLKANAFISVDTSVYPTLADFLASTGEEGYIYLYPSTNSEEGYYQYIWENGSWFNIGTTKIDLSDYYTKSQADTKFVPYTGATGDVNLENHIYRGYKIELGENSASEFTIYPADSHYGATRITGDKTIRISSTSGYFETNTKRYSSEIFSEVANVNYVDRHIFGMTSNPMTLTSDQALELIAGLNVRIHYNGYFFDRVESLISAPLYYECISKSKTSQDGYTTITKQRIALTFESGTYSLTHSSETLNVYDKSQADTKLATKQDVLTFDNAPTAGSQNPVTSAGIKTAIDNAISNVYRIKGSKTVAQLNAMTSADLTAGDVYNLLDSGTLDAGSIQVFTGDNVVWTGSAWDKLGTEIDWSAYDEKFIAAGFFEVQPYNESTGEITFVYSTELYVMSYDSDTGVMTIQAN